MFNLGGRWEPQFNIGMFSGEEGDWFRIGLGINLILSGRDPNPEAGRERARAYLRRYQDILRSDRRVLQAVWMAREEGLIQYQIGPPRRALRDPSAAAGLVAQSVVERTDWIFIGKWFFPDEPDDARVLADPPALVRTIDHAFAGLAPLYRAILG